MIQQLVGAAAIAALCAPGLAFAAAPSIGTASKSDQRICFEAGAPVLTPGTDILLLAPGPPQRTARARTGAATACPDAKPGYRLLGIKGSVPDDAVLAGIVNGAAQAGRRGLISARAPGVDHELMFRSCTSSDGVHLTAWGGTPLRSARLWHAYVYLDADLEPNCTPAETKAEHGG